jgi:hypothetical protein
MLIADDGGAAGLGLDPDAGPRRELVCDLVDERFGTRHGPIV